MASEFDHEHQRHLRRIITQLREGRFKFDPVEGFLKDRSKRKAQGKEPRPIVLATLKSRVVQRAILQVLQPRKLLDARNPDSGATMIHDPRLGRINDVNRSKFGVGGLIYPYGGVEPAIKSIRAAVDGGARYFFQSDIKSFFNHIPRSTVIEFIRQQTRDDDLVELFRAALDIHLRNPEELVDYEHLFPRDNVGVAQGSSLSAFAGNVLLFDLDHRLNRMGITSIRYIDDILMVSESRASLERAVEYATKELQAFNLDLYRPGDGSGKASEGECKDSISFLGCTIQPNRCVPSASAIKRFKAEVNQILSMSQSAISEAARNGNAVKTKMSLGSTLHTLGRKTYGWQKSFSFCTDYGPFQQLDNFLAKRTNDYYAFVDRQTRRLDPLLRMNIRGVLSMARIHEHQTKKEYSAQALSPQDEDIS
jgi:RNA-directed DNA polymerase